MAMNSKTSKLPESEKEVPVLEKSPANFSSWPFGANFSPGFKLNKTET
jgi:hypothetical protein